MNGLGEAIDGTGSTVDAVAGMVGQQLPATISITEETLSGLAQTAQVVDNALLLMSSIPLLGLDRYEPAVPLAQGIEQVVGSLAGIPASLGDAEVGLTTASDSLEVMQTEIAVMATQISEIGKESGRCCYCFSELTQVQSKIAGAGKTCSANYRAWYPNAAETREFVEQNPEILDGATDADRWANSVPVEESTGGPAQYEGEDDLQRYIDSLMVLEDS